MSSESCPCWSSKSPTTFTCSLICEDEIYQGDVIYFAPGEKHWHGAGPNSSLAHVAINLGTADTQTEWLEKVTDEEYGA